MSAPTSTNPAEVPRDALSSPQREARFTEAIQGQHGSYHAEAGDAEAPKRHSTLKKKESVSRKVSVKRSGSKKPEMDYIHSSGGQAENPNSVFYSPIPTQGGNPTEVLANRFAAWRKVLKDFITYFREVQTSNENRAKGINRIGQALNTTVHPPEFARSGGILETTNVLREFQKESYVNAENAAKIQAQIISALTALRRDLSDKVKEIKGLSGDFKNSVEREKEATRKEIVKLTDALIAIDSNPQGATGKNDPYLIKLGLEKQLKRQIDEENYLHKAYHNIENSGRELESIVVGEIQKAFDTYIKVLRREGEEFLDLAQRLDTATIKLPRDYEWSSFIERDPNMVHPSVPLRAVQDIEYPGYKHPAATEVLAGLMERKSKYLKSYTPGWYVLSSTHLHEFKPSERTNDSAPVMSLYLPESSLGKHSEPGAASHKFILKARQTGVLHRDHSWVFRAESHEAMLQWYENIKKLTEVSGEERNAYVAGAIHRRTESATEEPEAEAGSDDWDNDEADQVPYSAEPSAVKETPIESPKPVRPEGGRFPSDINVNRGLAEPEAVASEGDSTRSLIAAAGAISGGDYNRPEEDYTGPAGQRPRSDSNSSTWSYDDKVRKLSALIFCLKYLLTNETKAPCPFNSGG
ncbi:hypothetical protein L873DRAFT_1686105 [Choiromyces venosus 120613-1]|uniref:PH domain-containing protein n=1 Tax=Choiromyces venosus 120613-1 TaxID=1336337 RepID=A0A3N4JKU7_9PEZI|nr:hypothetical protein L873DRAFT_1686105 [Choiromyces venosus 120613-1]